MQNICPPLLRQHFKALMQAQHLTPRKFIRNLNILQLKSKNPIIFRNFLLSFDHALVSLDIRRNSLEQILIV